MFYIMELMRLNNKIEIILLLGMVFCLSFLWFSISFVVIDLPPSNGTFTGSVESDVVMFWLLAVLGALSIGCMSLVYKNVMEGIVWD